MAQLDGRLRFDNFVVGSANRLAVAAGRAVAESPGSTYNPLFVYSASGLGKTHLLAAIGNQALVVQPQLNIEYLILDEFMEQLHAAIATNQAETFARRYQAIDMLLLDDVQFLTGRRETQSELLRLFNALQNEGHQIVMTSDRPPSEISDVDERLITRLAGGLIVDIGAPDYETKVAILRNKCDERGVIFAPGVIEEIARIDYANVRELQGALNRLLAYQGLGGAEVNPAEVSQILGVTARPATPISSRSVPAPAPNARPAGGTGAEFQNFLSSMASVVAQHVEGWKTRITEAVAYWQGEGYRTAVLERALKLSTPPDVDGLLSTYAAAADHLRELEARAASVDPALGGNELFRDPERVMEAEALVMRALSGGEPPPGPSHQFTRDGFETGPSNQLAVNAADAVVAEPGARYNPLFIFGASGVGKTHLASAIGNALAATGRHLVAYVSAQMFIDELIAALQDGSVERWRARYRAADVLIVDDIQFVAGKERTQEELFHVFNALHGAGKQMVLTSDRPPKELQELEARLRSRFEGGLVVEVQPPDRVLREKLYARMLADFSPPPSPELLQYLADRPVQNVRELAGTVNRLVAAADVGNSELTLALAKAELEAGATSASTAPDVVTESIADTFFLDSEKVVWDWPEVAARLIEELR